MITIAAFQNSDLQPLRELFLKERKNTFTWTNTTAFELEDFDKQTQGEYILTAFLDNVPVGFISIWMPTNFIHHLYVDQKHQGKNIGTELLKAAITKTKFPITLKCLINNTKAIGFYTKKGFVEKEKGESNNGKYIVFKLTKDVK